MRSSFEISWGSKLIPNLLKDTDEKLALKITTAKFYGQYNSNSELCECKLICWYCCIEEVVFENIYQNSLIIFALKHDMCVKTSSLPYELSISTTSFKFLLRKCPEKIFGNNTTKLENLSWQNILKWMKKKVGPPNGNSSG